ncbi:MAG TPA: substrate-binding domain-containing protein [Thermoanaerobaculia bacterium]|nr:substrate-binding domain-containing protein [Thermoanaerobaculia bacterium]
MRREPPAILPARPAVRLLFALLAAGLAAACARTSAPGRSLRIAVIPQGSTHEYWKSIHAGAIKAARDEAQAGAGVEVIWKGPLREDDREQQVQVVEGFLTQRIDGIVLAPFDKNALVRPVEEASRSGIPVVVIDSALESRDPVSFVASDNHHGGELAAGEMGRLLAGRGRVLVLRYQEGVASTEAREKGFVEKLRASFPGIEIVSSNQYAGATRDTAKRASENLLNRYGQIDGIFTPNESSTAGMLLALEDLGRAGKIRLLGFDASEVFVAAMRAGELHGVVVQNPFRMGELGVKTLIDHLRGRKVEPRIDTGVALITPENLSTEPSQLLLHPPLDRYLR